MYYKPLIHVSVDETLLLFKGKYRFRYVIHCYNLIFNKLLGNIFVENQKQQE